MDVFFEAQFVSLYCRARVELKMPALSANISLDRKTHLATVLVDELRKLAFTLF